MEGSSQKKRGIRSYTDEDVEVDKDIWLSSNA
jgi:hypothetical protein